VCRADPAPDAHGDGARERGESRCGVDRIASATERRRMEVYAATYVRPQDVVRTIKLRSGDVLDCVPIEKQPAMRSAAMRGQKIQLLPSRATLAADRYGKTIGRPSTAERGPAGEASMAKQEYGGESELCPQRTVPIRRITMDILKNFRTLDDFFLKSQPKKGPTAKHQYAHAYRLGDNWGAQTILNVWGPYTGRSDEFSLAQMWVTRGSGSTLETVEAGWQKYRDFYGDYRPRLFIYFTPDNYGSGGCYNLTCGAFVQVNNSVYIGGGFTNISQHPHPSTAWEFKLRWQKDGTEGNWWLKYGDTWVGYYPRSKFDSNGLRSKAGEVDFGGEITNKGTDHTHTDMGSGHFPGDGFGYAAYQRQIRYITTANVWGTHLSLTDSRSDNDCYDIKVSDSSGDWERYFYFGGPGYNSQCE
jgi:hypothetical protein